MKGLQVLHFLVKAERSTCAYQLMSSISSQPSQLALPHGMGYSVRGDLSCSPGAQELLRAGMEGQG